MKSTGLLIVALFFALVSCDRPDSSPKKVTLNDVDNTIQNTRDSNFDTLTPGDQSENAADLTTTQTIRKAIVGNSSLSTNAQNIKVITINGKVTLRGVVDTKKEKEAIVQKIKNIQGVTNVDDQLEVKKGY